GLHALGHAGGVPGPTAAARAGRRQLRPPRSRAERPALGYDAHPAVPPRARRYFPKGDSMRILLARHGETPWNAEGRYQGQIDIPLSPVGEAQAAALGERLREVPVTRAVASPLSRARRTAELALGPDRAGMLQIDPDVQEIAHGEWEGLLASEIHEKDPARLRAWREEPDTVLMPGGESLRQVLDRSWRGLVRATEGLGADDTLLLV